jgi:hypothetical protein
MGKDGGFTSQTYYQNTCAMVKLLSSKLVAVYELENHHQDKRHIIKLKRLF